MTSINFPHLDGTADAGDIVDPDLVFGPDEAAIDRAEELEELTDLENGGPPLADEVIDLPGEAGDGPLGAATTTAGAPGTPLPADGGADTGDEGGPEVLGLGYPSSALDAAEAHDELVALELAMPPIVVALPGDDAGPYPAPGTAPPANNAAAIASPISPTGLVDQPTKVPSRKVKAAGLGGIVAAIPAPLLALLDRLPVPSPVLAAISSSLAVAGSVAAAYAARDKVPLD